MKKLKLKLRVDELRIQTFVVSAEAGERGTVQGHYGANHTAETGCLGSCPPDTCYISCDAAMTCHGMAC